MGTAVSADDLPDGGNELLKAGLPNLWRGAGKAGKRKGASGRFDADPERPVRGDYFFLPAADLAATAAFFEASALLAFDCFCEDFFWLAFGDLSPMVIPWMEVC